MPSSLTPSEPLSDEIIDAVRATRDAYAARFGYDVSAIFRDAKAREGASPRPVVSFPPRRVPGVGPADVLRRGE